MVWRGEFQYYAYWLSMARRVLWKPFVNSGPSFSLFDPCPWWTSPTDSCLHNSLMVVRLLNFYNDGFLALIPQQPFVSSKLWVGWYYFCIKQFVMHNNGFCVWIHAFFFWSEATEGNLILISPDRHLFKSYPHLGQDHSCPLTEFWDQSVLNWIIVLPQNASVCHASVYTSSCWIN